jgi:hypothetical protein
MTESDHLTAGWKDGHATGALRAVPIALPQTVLDAGRPQPGFGLGGKTHGVNAGDRWNVSFGQSLDAEIMMHPRAGLARNGNRTGRDDFQLPSSAGQQA